MSHDQLSHLQNESLYAILQFIPQQHLLPLRRISTSFYNCVNSCVHDLVYDCNRHFEKKRDIFSTPSVPKSLWNLYVLELRNNEYLSLKEFTTLWISQMRNLTEVRVVKCDLQMRPQAFFPVSKSYFKRDLLENGGGKGKSGKDPLVGFSEGGRVLRNDSSTQQLQFWERTQPQQKVVARRKRGWFSSLLGRYLPFTCSDEDTSIDATVVPPLSGNPGKRSHTIEELYTLEHEKYNHAWEQYQQHFDGITVNLSHLRKLHLEETRIQDSGLHFIFEHAQNLQELTLSHCSNLLQPKFNMLSNSLESLTVNMCRSLTLEHLQECKKLRHLLVNAVKQVLLSKLFEGNRLVSLSMGSQSLYQVFESCSFPELLSLTLQSSMSITDEILSQLADAAPKLEELTVVNCRNLNAPKLAAFRALKKVSLSLGLQLEPSTTFPKSLESLVFKWNPLTVWDTFCDVHTHKLNDLCFQQCEITDVEVEKALYQNDTMISLNLSGCKRIEDPSIVHPTLKHIDLSQTKVNDERVQLILSHCLSLETMHLRLCNEVSNPQIASSQLLELSLSGTNIKEDGLMSVIKGCPNLRSLELSRCNKMKWWADVFRTLHECNARNPLLRELNVSDNGSSLTDECLAPIFRYFCGVRTFICRWNELKEPEQGIFDSLVMLDVTGCRIEADYLKSMPLEYPDLTIIH